MADFTDMLGRAAADRQRVLELEELHRLREQKRHWDCESRQRREQIAELCAEVGRLQRENQLLTDQLREETDATAAYQAWLVATQRAARR